MQFKGPIVFWPEGPLLLEREGAFQCYPRVPGEDAHPSVFLIDKGISSF
jgi:hypothetical protein